MRVLEMFLELLHRHPALLRTCLVYGTKDRGIGRKDMLLVVHEACRYQLCQPCILYQIYAGVWLQPSIRDDPENIGKPLLELRDGLVVDTLGAEVPREGAIPGEFLGN